MNQQQQQHQQFVNGTTKKKQLAPALPYDIVGGLPLISCPQPSAAGLNNGHDNMPAPVVGSLYNPVISFTYTAQAVLALGFAIAIWWRYGSVRLFGRRIHNQYLTNHLWVWFFTSVGVSSIMDATRYFSNSPYHLYANTSITIPGGQEPSVPRDGNTTLAWFYDETDEDERHRAQMEYLRNFDSGFLLGSTILRSLSVLFLVLALCWQLRFRSGGFNVPGGGRGRRRRNEDRGRQQLSPKNGYFDTQDESSDEEDGHDSEYAEEHDEHTSMLLPESSSSLTNADARATGSGNSSNSQLFSATVPLLTAALRGESASLRLTGGQRKKPWWRRMCRRIRSPLIFSVEKLALIQFFSTLVILYINITPIPTGNALLWAYICLFAAAWIPAWLLSVRILLTKTSPSPSSTARIIAMSSGNATIQQAYGAKQGPTLWAKLFLSLGLVLSLAFIAPPNMWSRFLHSIGIEHEDDEDLKRHLLFQTASSPFEVDHRERSHPIHIPFGSHQIAVACIQPVFQGYVSFIDIIQWLGLIGLVFLFLFVRNEFMRCKERVVWATVSQVQDTFGFLRRANP